MNATLEVDTIQLRNFHKAHFLGRTIPSLRETSTLLPDSSTSTWKEEDDDEKLGCYHNGVKRTLTDEQIAMFRHSEIHRLLQHRRLNADLPDGRPAVQERETPDQSKQARREIKIKRPRERAALQSEDVALDYGQEGNMPEQDREQGKRKDHCRKVVRYVEGSNQSSAIDDVDGSSQRTSASQPFHWPKLGS